MPMKAPRVCACGRRVPSGVTCVCQKARAAARPSARERGYDSKWDREKKAFLALPGNGVCQCGCGRKADMVDHEPPHKGDMKRFWDKSTWRAFSRRCNSKKAAKYEGGFGNPLREFGEGDQF